MSVSTQLIQYEDDFIQSKNALVSACTNLKDAERDYENAVANYECCVENDGSTGCDVPSLTCSDKYELLQIAKSDLAAAKTAFYEARTVYFTARDALVCYAKTTIKELCKEDFSC